MSYNFLYKYFKSSEVKAFPCAYRGTTTTTEDTTADIDQFSRVPTEYNLTRPTSAFNGYDGSSQHSYIINYTPKTVDGGTGRLEIVINGYYFDITSTKIGDDLTINQGCWLALCTTNINDDVHTRVLASFENGSKTELDREAEIEKETISYFTALAYGSSYDEKPKGISDYILLTTENTYGVKYNQVVSADGINAISGRILSDDAKDAIYNYHPAVQAESYPNTIATGAIHSIALGNGLTAATLYGSYFGNFNDANENTDAIFVVGNGDFNESGATTCHNALAISTSTITLNNDVVLNQVKFDIADAADNAHQIVSVDQEYGENVENNITEHVDSHYMYSTAKSSTCGIETVISAASINQIYQVASSSNSASPAIEITLDGSDMTNYTNTIKLGTRTNAHITIPMITLNGNSGQIECNNIQFSGYVALKYRGTPTSISTKKVLYTEFEDQAGRSEYPFYVTGNGDINTSSSIYADYNVEADGYVEASYFNAVSDARLKENIEEFIPAKSILDLPIKKYDFINGIKGQIGCIAQDLQEICPEIVHENEDGYLSIQESKIVYLLLDEVKKLKEEVEELKKK